MNLVLNFTHTYSVDWIEENKELKCIDCSDIAGTDMYCTPEAEEELESRLSEFPLGGIHFIDSGNYHYMTRLFTKRISGPYNLVFFDNHNDMQPTMIPELLSCGAWAKQVIEEDENLQRLILIGPGEKTINDIDVANSDKLVCVSREELREWSMEEGCDETASEEGQNMPVGKPHYRLREKLAERLAEVSMDLPLYVSVDKDVMGEEYARTNWDQGDMSLETLKELLKYIYSRLTDCGGKLIAVDICGELPQKDASFAEAAEAEEINRRTNQELYMAVRAMPTDCYSFSDTLPLEIKRSGT